MRLSPPPDMQFLSTGCTALNCVLGGGYAMGRVVNIVGDKATGKSLLAIEACSNFARQFHDGFIWYRESESAFLTSYAKKIGAPIERISFIDRRKSEFDTVEAFYKDLDQCCDRAITRKKPGLYILDSLDALSDEAEMERDISAGSFGASKAKKMSETFRRIVGKIEKAQVCLMIISQVRANIGATFGRKVKRTGGMALDFYASQIVYLAHLGQITKTLHGQEHVVGVRVRAKCDKNKVGDAFRQCDFTIRMNYGVDDLSASLDYLIQTKRLGELDITEKGAKAMANLAMSMSRAEYQGCLQTVNAVMRRVWLETETELLPAHRKYD